MGTCPFPVYVSHYIANPAIRKWIFQSYIWNYYNTPLILPDSFVYFFIAACQSCGFSPNPVDILHENPSVSKDGLPKTGIFRPSHLSQKPGSFLTFKNGFGFFYHFPRIFFIFYAVFFRAPVKKAPRRAKKEAAGGFFIDISFTPALFPGQGVVPGRSALNHLEYPRKVQGILKAYGI